MPERMRVDRARSYAAAGSERSRRRRAANRPEDRRTGEQVAAAGWLVDAVGAGRLALPLPGSGATLDRFRALAALGVDDPVRARLGEGHVDAVAILAELDGPAPGEHVWGVWAAKPDSVVAETVRDGWVLTGDRPWCSGAGVCTRALVTARAPDGIRLFAVDPRDDTAVPLEGTWPAVGMAASDTRTVRFLRTPGVAVGGPGSYTQRPGFTHGGIGVAACWYGGAAGIAGRLLSGTRTGLDDPFAIAHLGSLDAALAGAAVLLREAATRIDADPGQPCPLLAARTRAVVEAAAWTCLDAVGRALGAEPLGHDRSHARRVADLTVYLRQSHAERDLAALGGRVTREPGEPWVL